MKLKSLLPGSAAVLVAVSGARAADAIVVEPEPVEYVRICDAFGAGYFYIPGTETCLKFSGRVRTNYNARNFSDDTNTHAWQADIELNVLAKSSTEHGDLTSHIRLNYGSAQGADDVLTTSEGPSDGSPTVQRATIALGGFETGYFDNYWSKAGDYGFFGTRFSGPYNYRSGLYAQYTHGMEGLDLTIGIEDGTSSGEAGAPDIYAGAVYKAGGLYLAGIYYMDSSEESGAWKVRGNYDFGNGFKVGGWYAADEGKTDYVLGTIWGATASFKLNDTMTLAGGYGVYDDEHGADGGYSEASVGLVWNIVPGLTVIPEYHMVTYSVETATQKDYNELSLRITRSF